MMRRALKCGLPLIASEVDRHAANRDPRAPISKNFDPKPDPKRTIAGGDLVHESVMPRGHADGKDHNDPPPGHPVATDE